MPQARAVKCDVPGCDCTKIEAEYGIGWDGWTIWQGMCVADKKPEKASDMTSYICPEHSKQIAELITQYLGNVGGEVDIQQFHNRLTQDAKRLE